MATSVESSSSPASLHKGSASLMGSSPTFSPSSDKRFWSHLRGRVDTLLDNRKPIDDQSLPIQLNDGATQCAKRLKEDTMLLMRGFDSVAHSLSQLSNNLENALQGARDLAKPPTLTQILQCTLEKAKSKEDGQSKKENADENDEAREESEEGKRGLKRKSGSQECSEEKADDSHKKNDEGSKELGKFNKAKNLAIAMATKSSALAKELKSLKSDLSFMQERSTLLEEENRRLRDGFANNIHPEEDDLVRLQMEALLSEKSRLAYENANLTRENQCLRQLVEYHQLTSQDLSASYENLIRGMGLNFSSPEDLAHKDTDEDDVKEGQEVTEADDICNLSRNLNEFYDEGRE